MYFVSLNFKFLLFQRQKRKVRHEEKENFTEMKKLAKSDKTSIDNNTSIGLDR